jgi:hypothetical protein
MIPKATEDTITSLLQVELSSLGVRAELLPSVTTPAGVRRPDILCANGGIYPLEAKFTKNDLLSAIAKVQNDYLKHSRLLNIRGGFAILYPSILSNPMQLEAVKDLALSSSFRLVAMFPTDDPRPFKNYDGHLKEIAKVIAELVLTPQKIPVPSIDFIIKSLREAAMQLISGLKHLTSKELEGFFGGGNVFRHILQFEENKYPVEELKMGAAYLLVNQLLFYHAISRFRTEFEPIDPDNIRKPQDLQRCFSKVLDINYKTVFSYDVSSLLPEQSSDEVKTIVSVIHALSPEKVGSDLLGTIFHDLIPFETRKNVAAFYTNVLAAELLAYLSIDNPRAKVADFSVGSGGLLVAAYRRKRSLLKARLSQEMHRQFVEEDLLGVDVMPFAANTAACHLALQSPQHFTNKVRIAVWDSTDLSPGQTIPSVADLEHVLSGQTFIDFFSGKNTEKKGVVSLHNGDSEDIKLKKCDLVIMNPPFTRHERIFDEYKDLLLDRFKKHEEYITGQMGYYGYFVLLADKFIEKGGRMALVLPASVLRVKSCEGLRKLWAETYHVDYIILTSFRSAFSESTRLREMLIVARKSKKRPTAKKTKLVMLRKLPKSLKKARTMAQKIESSSKGNGEIEIRQIDYSDLQQDTHNWFAFFALTRPQLFDDFNNQMKSIPNTRLAETTDIIRGYEMRGGLVQSLTIYESPSKLLKSSDIWLQAETDSKQMTYRHRASDALVFTVPLSSLTHTIRRPSGLAKLNVYDDLDYVVTSIEKPETLRRLTDATGFSLPKNTLDSLREDIERRLGNLFISADFDLSAPGTHWLSFYCSEMVAPSKLLWSMRLDSDDAKVLCLFFNSSFNLVQLLAKRVETRGAFMRTRKYFLENFLVPDTSNLNPEVKRNLVKLFDSIQSIEVPSILEQLRCSNSVRKQIDKAWLEVFGCQEDFDSYLTRLYSMLASEIATLKSLMIQGTSSEEKED